MKREAIRTWHAGRFHLELFDTGRRDWRGQSRLAYTFQDNGNVIFEGRILLALRCMPTIQTRPLLLCWAFSRSARVTQIETTSTATPRNSWNGPGSMARN